MQLDPARYRHHLASFGLSDNEELEFMGQLWRIAHYFADQAFGVTSEQILLGIDRTICGPSTETELDSDGQLYSTFNDAAFGSAGRKSNP